MSEHEHGGPARPAAAPAAAPAPVPQRRTAPAASPVPAGARPDAHAVAPVMSHWAEGGHGAAAPGGAPGAPAGGVPPAVTQQLAAGGVHVALGLQPTQADITRNRDRLFNEGRTRGTTLRAILNRSRGMLGATGQWQQLHGQADQDRPPTQQEAQMLAQAIYNNDLEFGRRALEHARARQAISGAAGALVVGHHIAFTSADDPLAMVLAVSQAVESARTSAAAAPGGAAPHAPAAANAPHAPAPANAPHAPAPAAAPHAPAPANAPHAPAPAPAGGPAPQAAQGGAAAQGAGLHNIAELAIFTHGSTGQMSLGHSGSLNGGQVASRLSGALAGHVQVQLYGCNAAGGDNEGEGSFAAQFAQTLGQDGHTARVFGHTDEGHTTRNSNGRAFTTGPGGALSHASNFQTFFPQAFLQAEAQRLAPVLGSSREEVAAVLERAARAWLAGAWGRLRHDGQPASYTVGYDPSGTARSVQTVWQGASEGQAAVARSLRPRRA